MSMKITIIGAGAMGCLIGGRMVKAGHAVSFIARGAQLQALQRDGLVLESTGERWQSVVRATDAPDTLGPQDALIICTKAYQLASIVPLLPPLMHGETMLVPAINGIPWWYFERHGGPFEGRQLRSLDPEAVLYNAIAAKRIIGCVNYLAGTLTKPGHVHYVPELERRIALGELDGEMTPRLHALGEIFYDAGFAPTITATIRDTIWHKLWGNIAFNPISALTHGTIDQIAEGYHDIDLVMAVMNETRFIADKLGIALTQTTKSRVDAAAKMRGHKTSMLIDMEHGRPTEIEAIVGAVREIGKWMEAGTPYLNSLYSLVKLKEKFYAASASAGAHA